MEIDIEDVDGLISCEECGVCYSRYKTEVNREKEQWYGTEVTTICPVCKHKEVTNLNDGYYKN